MTISSLKIAFLILTSFIITIGARATNVVGINLKLKGKAVDIYRPIAHTKNSATFQSVSEENYISEGHIKYLLKEDGDLTDSQDLFIQDKFVVSNELGKEKMILENNNSKVTFLDENSNKTQVAFIDRANGITISKKEIIKAMKEKSATEMKTKYGINVSSNAGSVSLNYSHELDLSDYDCVVEHNRRLKNTEKDVKVALVCSYDYDISFKMGASVQE